MYFIKMKLCLVLGFCDIGVRSVLEECRAGKTLAVLASHIHIRLLWEQQRLSQED